MKHWRWMAVVATAAPAIALAQVTTDVGRAPTLSIERYSEDWSYLGDPDRRSGHWTEPFKYIRLSDVGTTYLTTGIEGRLRYEHYENVNWGASPDDSYLWQRLMPYADLHAGSARLFVQPIVSAMAGAEHASTPVDTTGIDMLQVFGDIEMAVTPHTALRLSAGRKLISLGAGRLIDNRYGPNVPLAFDGVEATLVNRERQVKALYFRPVDNELDDFDDSISSHRAVWGLYATQWLNRQRTGGFDFYYLGFRDRDAVFDQGAGRESIHTVGSRLFGDTGAWFWNLEGALQRGTFDGDPVRAWGGGGEIGHRFLQASWQPEAALTTDVVSGDDDRDDAKLGTFNPMFPRGKYFGAMSPIGPRNLIQIRPSATVHPRRDVAVTLSGVAYWRESKEDGVYSIPGALVRRGKGSNARFIGKQIELAIAWQASAELNLSASISAFEPGAFLRDTGPSRTLNLVGAMANFRF